ncbi:hypothetical protein [Nocardia sp. CA-135398]|uniref:hypothetical protein n=1 Tax=Nocardia sp. CA-135398 TaxID=3239977 RepID=UPI003D9530F2
MITMHVRRLGASEALLCLLSGLVATWAVAGVLGLMTGSLDLGATIEDRIPFHSPAFAGLMLALVVGFPMTVTALFAARDDERTPLAAMISGLGLVGWILVQLVVIREFSWLQPIWVGFGLAVLLLGGALLRRYGART